MVLSIVVVISGVVCACLPLWLHPDSRDPSVAGTYSELFHINELIPRWIDGLMDE
jgi:hypothetical protein